MRYSEILQHYETVSCGDFMRQYSIGDRSYIIYSPEPGSISCLDLLEFKDLSPEGLAILIQYIPGEDDTLEEFKFERACERDHIISFLFKIELGKDTDGKRKRVKGLPGSYAFPLRDIRSSKIRNTYLFDPISLRSSLLFQNDICYASANDDVNASHINVCWDPSVFASLEDEGIKTGPTYLLASSNPILCAHLSKLAKEKKSQINIHSRNKALEALLFISSYMGEARKEKSINVFSGSNVTVSVKGWHPVSLVKFISSLQRQFDSKMNEIYSGGAGRVTLYRLESIGGNSFIVFPRISLAIDVFNEAIIHDVGLEGVYYIKD